MAKTRSTNTDEASTTRNILFNDPIVQHIALVVLGLSENDPLCHAISQNFDNIEDILEGRTEDFENLPVVINAHPPQPLYKLKPLAHNKLLTLQRFALHHRQVNGEDLDYSFWLSVTRKELQDFRHANLHHIVANNFNSVQQIDKKTESCCNPHCGAKEVYFAHQGDKENTHDVDECAVDAFDM